MIRKIVQIDEAKCDGCGDCIPSCAEGALYLEGGKVRLSADVLCDGLGACLGECPRGAIEVVEREAASFDHHAVERHLARRSRPSPLPVVAPVPAAAAGGCPGSRAMQFAPAAPAVRRGLSVVPDGPAIAVQPAGGSRLGQWPVQLHLVSTAAPYFRGADLLVAADCVPFAYARFHEDFLAGRRVVVGCPKLDDNAFYTRKLAELIGTSGVRSVTVVKMEVPCCGGIAAAARQAIADSGRPVPLEVATIGVQGSRLP